MARNRPGRMLKKELMKPAALRLIATLLFFWPAFSVTAQPSIGGYRVFYGHLHNHCNVSDGAGTPDSAYKYAKNTAHLDFFSLADHSGSISSTEWTTLKTTADAYNEPGVFTAFRGFEWSSSSKYGHVAVIGTNDYCTTSSPTSTFTTFCDWLNDRECVAFFNHPGREDDTGKEFDHFFSTPSNRIVGMELWNKNDAFTDYYYNDGYYSGDGTAGYFDEANSRNWRAGASGSEDNHVGTWGNYNNYRLAVLADTNTRDSIYNALKSRRFFTTLDKNMALSFTIDGAEMGATLQPGTYAFRIRATDANAELFTQVRLMRNGTVERTWTPGVASPDLSGELECADAAYYYVIVHQSDGDEAISSPIWISNGNLPPVVNLAGPEQNKSFPSPACIQFAAVAADPDDSVSAVSFYQDTILLATDHTAPYSFTWNDIGAGNYTVCARATDSRGSSRNSPSIAFTVVNPGDPVIATFAIATGTDDAEESSAGVMYLSSTDIELVYDSYNSAGNQTVGLRFTGLDIPPGTVVEHAFVQFTCDEVTTGSCNLMIRAENSDNAATFNSGGYNVSTRPVTTAGIAWVPPAWPVADASGPEQKTPDLAPVLQEVVNRPGFSASSAIVLIITGTGKRTAEAYEGVATAGAELTVTYSYPTAPPPGTAVTLRAFLEGLYAGNARMNAAMDENGVHWDSTVADKIDVELHDGLDYETLVKTFPGIDLHVDGSASFVIPGAVNGQFSLTLKHRTSLPTVTKLLVQFSSGPVSYSFIDNASKAYGDNLRNMTDGFYAIYGGNTNGDEFVDSVDMGAVENDSQNFSVGYLPTDVNGDGISDSADMTIIDCNSANFAGIVIP